MRARDFALRGLLDVMPVAPRVPKMDREEALRDALRDLRLGAFDEQAVRNAVSMLDALTVQVLVTWLVRVADAAYEAGAYRVLDSMSRRLAEEIRVVADRGEGGGES